MSDSDRSQTRVTLIRRLAATASDKDAWREFVEHYGKRIHRWCRAKGLQVADAEDLTQDLLAKLAVRFRSFQYDPTRSFRAWLKTITKNALADAFKKNRRAQQRLDNAAARAALFEELDPQFDREVLDEAMARIELRVEHATWEAFRLTSIEGHSAVEAAERLGVPQTRVRVQKGRVAKLIRDEVRKLGGIEA